MPSGRMLIFGAMVDDEMRALGKLQREQEPTSPFVFTSVRGSPFTAAGFAPMVERAGVEARLGFPAHPHMLRHACGFALANKGHDTRACRPTLATATSSTRCDTPSCRRAGSRTSGDDRIHMAESIRSFNPGLHHRC